MSLFLTQLFDGLALGAIYASLALAIVLVYQSTELLNFAQGEMAMFAAYIAWQLGSFGFSPWLALAVTLPIAFLAGLAIERTVIRKFENKSGVTVMVVTLGLFLVINNAAGWIWGFQVKSFPSIFPPGIAITVGGAPIAWGTIGTVGLLIVVVGVLYLLINHTRIGLAMRAVAGNPESSSLAGLRVGRLLMLGWGLGSALGAISGILVAPKIFLQPSMMFGVLIYAFTAAVLGGMDSLVGAVVGGLLVGVTENLAGTYIPWIGSDLKFAVALIIIIAVLLIRPAGLLGSRRVARV